MPAYATNMRLKFPILALTLEIITIILFALFTVYDDGKPHGHDGHDAHDAHSNDTKHEAGPMDLYPSKYEASTLKFSLKVDVFHLPDSVSAERSPCLPKVQRKKNHYY